LRFSAIKRFSIPILLLCCTASILAQGFVHADGKRIVDGNGELVLKRGMGLGGWMVPEGYMLQWSPPGSPTQIRNQIVELIGEEAADRFYEKYEAKYVTREDILLLGEWGFDHIRFPFHYKQFSPEPGVWVDKGFNTVDSLITWCREAGLHLVLDMHAAPGAQNGGPISDSDGTAWLWFLQEHQDHAVQIWREIARRYANETQIGGYDLLNEPVHWGVSGSVFKALYVRIVNAIREVDTDHIVFIEGNWYGTDFNDLKPPFDSNMAYSFHKYWSINSTGSIQSYLDLRETYNVPLWMGESGENSNHWYSEATDLLEENEIGWCWWAHKKYETITSPFSAKLPDGFDVIQAWLNGHGNKPSPAFAEAILMRMADALETDECVYRPGFVPALFDDEYETVSKPVKFHRLPGGFLAADYDIGANGLAYFDNVVDTRHCCGDPYTPWNEGHQYRNDGVDLQQPEVSGVPSVHWIERGEWLQYTTTFAHNGFFDFHFEVASTDGGGEIELFVDDTSRGKLQIGATGGGSSWKYLSMDGIRVNGGQRLLRLEFTSEGFNLQRIRVTVNEALTDERFPVRFTLGENYPNPFNSTTAIPMEINRPDGLKLEIIDLLGRPVQRYDLSDRLMGPTEVTWEGTNSSGDAMPAGVYYYRLSSGKEIQTAKMLLIR